MSTIQRRDSTSGRDDAVRRSEARYRALVDASTLMMWHESVDGVAADMPFWRALTGQTAEDLRAGRWTEAIHPADLPRLQELRREAHAKSTSYESEFRVRLENGDYRWFRSRAVPVLDEHGKLLEWVGLFDDIEEERRTAESRDLLERTTRVLAASLDVRSTFRAVARLAIDGRHPFADLARIDVPSDGGFECLVFEDRDPELARDYIELERRHPVPANADAGFPRVIATGEPDLVADLEAGLAPRIADVANPHLDMLRRIQMYSGLCVPLRARNSVLGALTLIRHGPERGRRYDERDLAIAQEVAERVGVALEVAMRYQEAERARAEAEAAHQRAEDANRAKSDFLATMSHELRTPLNAIVGYAQLLEMGVGGSLASTQKEHVERLRGSAQHLLMLVNDVLDLAKIDAGELSVTSEVLALPDPIRQAITLTLPQAEARGIRLEDLTEGKTGARFIGDPDRFRQILVNLLSNAVKFTDRGGRVTIEVGRREDTPTEARLMGGGPWMFVQVSDTGIGIPPEQQSAVFEPFVQLETGRKRTRGGTGLGLAISRRFARLMGGDLTLRSVSGSGSTFTVWLPAPDGTESAAERVRRARGLVGAPRKGGLQDVGRALRADLEQIVERWGQRLRADPEFADVRDLPTVEIEDHGLAFVADLVHSLIIVEHTGGLESDLLREGTSLQRHIARQHGRQRKRLGWTESMLVREYDLLINVLRTRVLRHAGDSPDATISIGILVRLLTRSLDAAMEGLRKSSG